MQSRSGLFEAGTILVLVGAIIGLVGSIVVLLLGLSMGAVGSAGGEESFGLAVVGVVYILLGVVGMAGAVVGLLAHRCARRGDARGAWVRGLVASLLPPVQVVLLIGAILCKVSPECKGQETGRQTQPPGVDWSPR